MESDLRKGAKLSRARALRQEETLAEKRLWEQLRNRTLEGFKFRLQVPVGPFIADFLCRDLKLIVEVDGAAHSTGKELIYDNRRSAFLNTEGFRVIRFQNEEVVHGILTLILEALQN